jgi:replicative DNA helicase
MNDFERIPPSNLEAEKSVIGSMLLDNSVIPEVQELLSHDSFFREAHQRAYRAISDIYEIDEHVDPLLLFEHLRKSNQLDEPGRGELTSEYIGDILDNTPTAANAVYYARIVADKATTRKVIQVAMGLLREGFDGSQPSANLLADAESRVLEIIRSVPEESKSMTIRDACLQFVDSLRVSRRRMFGSGIVDLDEAIGGCALGEMIVIAARPSHGKSAFALHWLHEAAAGGVPCLIISEEMKADDLAKRAMMRFASYDQELWNASCADNLAEDVKKHYSGKAPIFVAENCHTIRRAESTIRKFASKGVKIVAVDYLQLLGASGQKRYEQVGEVSRRLKLAAQKYDVAILALSQLNRGIEERKVFSPKMCDLRESGSIEQDADAILFLVWPWALWSEEDHPATASKSRACEDPKEPEKTEYRVIVGKNCRNRRTNKRRVSLRFDSERMTFSSVSANSACAGASGVQD